MSDLPESLDLARLRAAYADGGFTPRDLMGGLSRRIAARGEDGVWTWVAPEEALAARAEELMQAGEAARAAMPLWGVPFAVKDCIDVAGVPTTAACPEYAYEAAVTNPGVARLLAAGAIFVGKTNLDQFATGLVGARSPWGTPPNPFDARYLPGGSSAGAGVSVAAGLVSFGLGTDTGGSGRVPAGYTATVGLKPSRGFISNRHMVPACRTLDCISVYALTAPDALALLRVAAAEDPSQPFSRAPWGLEADANAWRGGFTFMVPGAQDLEFYGDALSEKAFEDAVSELEAMGGTAREVDYAPFREVNAMMFQGPMVAERLAIFRPFLEANPQAGHPVVRDILLGARRFSATDVYEMLYRLEALSREIAALFAEHGLMAVPTIGRPFTVAELEAEPVKVNFDHGYYTNFVNPADLAALAVPNGIAADGMPRGITLIAPAGSEGRLTPLADAFHRRRMPTLGATGAVQPP